jgi:hypothetical protein
VAGAWEIVWLDKEAVNFKESEYTEMSEYSGMVETTYRKYLKHMRDILNINDKSRFINILTIVRPESEKNNETDIIKITNNKKQADIITKKCKGARDTLIFGETLINANGENCVTAQTSAQPNTYQGAGNKNKAKW